MAGEAYEKLASDDDLSRCQGSTDEQDSHICHHLQSRKTRVVAWYVVSLVLGASTLILSLVVLYLTYYHLPLQSMSCSLVFDSLLTEIASTKSQHLVQQRIEHSDFASPDHAVADSNWASIEATHGFVGLGKDWATAQQLPASIESPLDPTQSVYVVDAYHQLHCLVRLGSCQLRAHVLTWQKLLRRAILGGELRNHSDSELTHFGHCFDELRQGIICSAAGKQP